MSKQQPNPRITPRWLLDRIDFQLFSARYSLGRLKKNFDPDAEEFAINIDHELKELVRRVGIAQKRIRELQALPKATWKKKSLHNL